MKEEEACAAAFLRSRDLLLGWIENRQVGRIVEPFDQKLA